MKKKQIIDSLHNEISFLKTELQQAKDTTEEVISQREPRRIRVNCSHCGTQLADSMWERFDTLDQTMNKAFDSVFDKFMELEGVLKNIRKYMAIQGKRK